MTRTTFLIMLLFNSLWCYGQVENRWQPDSLYKNKYIKKIYVYENSQKDLSEIVEFDRKGNIAHIKSYSASYNAKTRKSKKIDRLTQYLYDSSGRLSQKIDSIIYNHNHSVSTNKTVYYYEEDLLISSKYYKGEFEKPYSETIYTYKPFTSTTTIKADTLITYRKTKEYERDFYVKRFYGFVLEPRLKNTQSTINGKIVTLAYSDNTDIQRFNEEQTILNTFDQKGKLIKSEIKSIFRNDRKHEYTLSYNYNRNGLLMSIRGYVPLYFKYEYF